jgi:hypothetical protein
MNFVLIGVCLVAGIIIRFPPFIASLAALILPLFLDLHPVTPLLERLSGTLVPFSLFSVGILISLVTTALWWLVLRATL